MYNPYWLKSDSCHRDPGLTPPEILKRDSVLSLCYQSTNFCSLEWAVIKVKDLEDLPVQEWWGLYTSHKSPRCFFSFKNGWIFSLEVSLIYTASHNYIGKPHFKNKKKRSLISIFLDLDLNKKKKTAFLTKAETTSCLGFLFPRKGPLTVKFTHVLAFGSYLSLNYEMATGVGWIRWPQKCGQNVKNPFPFYISLFQFHLK